MLCKSIQDGLPAFFLLFDGVLGFGHERHAHGDPVRSLHEFDRGYSLAKFVFNQLMWDYLGVGTCKIKSKVAIFGFHA